MGFGSLVRSLPRKGLVSQMSTPDQQGISDSKYIWKLMGDIPITQSYVKYLLNGPPIGTVKKYPAGWCLSKGILNAPKRTITINTKPEGKIHIPGINSNAFGTIQNMRGLIPGVLNDMWDITPVNIWNNMQGKGPVIKDCFTDYSKIIKNKSYNKIYIYSILILSLLVLYIFYNIIKYK